MKDVQGQQDHRGVSIQRVGVKDVHLPFQVREKENGFQSVLGQATLSVDLPHHYKGTHLSRFIEILLDWSQRPISTHEVEEILQATRLRLDAERAQTTLRFKYFVVHDNLLRPGARERIHALLEHFLGAPRAYAQNVYVYAVYGGGARPQGDGDMLGAEHR